MTVFRTCLLLGFIAFSPAFAQVPADLPDIGPIMAQAQQAIVQAQQAMPELAAIPRLSIAPFQPQAAKLADATSAEYDAGTRLLDQRQYDKAIQVFDKVINRNSDRADGALYWKAYALNRIGRRDDALAALATLRRDHTNSRWLNDAAALQVEVNQNAGRPVSPADESNDDIKLMAINGLMNADPDRAIPMLEGVLKGNASPKVKDRALFVLTQSRSPKAQQILSDYAKGAGNPDLQIRAVRFVGMSGTPEARQQLTSIYSASNDKAVKSEIIRSLMISQGRDAIFNIAKNETDPSLRGEAIRQLGVLKAIDQLQQLNTSSASQGEKTEIIRALMIAGASDKLAELARAEKDLTLRAEALRYYALSPSVSTDALVAMYSGDAQTKREIVNALASRADAKALIALARKETDSSMKAYIVQRLSMQMSNNKEVIDYMQELLK